MYIVHSDAVCCLCGAKIVINNIHKWEDGCSTEECHCYNCNTDLLVERDHNGMLKYVGIDGYVD